MAILAIDTSCDDTCIAIIEADKRGYQPRSSPSLTLGTLRGRRRITRKKFNVLSNVVSSQARVHRKYGGVYPTLAKREHQRNLVTVLNRALKKADLLKIFNFHASLFSIATLRGVSHFVQSSNEFSNPNFQTIEKILEREPKLLKALIKFFQHYKKPKVDAITVTVGPGLEPCLWIGVNFARALAYWWDLPIVPVNHVEAHIFANFIDKFQISPKESKLPTGQASFKFQELFPAICLVASGGHTQLILMKQIGKYKIIGETRDDAAGECFDKTARILGLPYPGGPAIAAEAAKIPNSKFQIPNKFKSNPTGSPPRDVQQSSKATLRGVRPRASSKTKLPRPMINSKDYDFSFSGLKTAVLYDFKKRTKKIRNSKEYIREMAKEIQQAIIDVLIKKTIRAAKEYKVKTIILGGGVAANEELRRQFREKIKKEILNSTFLIPNSQLCTDNAAMVGVTAHFHLRAKRHWGGIKASANLRIG